MTVEITVRGTAERRYAAEAARIELAVEVQGADRSTVVAEATSKHAAVTAALATTEQAGQVSRWSADAVHAYAERPWGPDGESSELRQVARLAVRAQFVDFAELNRFIDTWSADQHVQLVGLTWELTDAHQREFAAVVRTEAVADAVAKAQTYADAVRAGTVVPTHLADPGLLASVEPGPRAMMAMSADAAYGSALALVPDDIVVRCEVDARFVAG